MKKHLILFMLLISVNLSAKMLSPKELGIVGKQNIFVNSNEWIYINTNMIVGLIEDIDGCTIRLPYTFHYLKSVNSCEDLAKIINK